MVKPIKKKMRGKKYFNVICRLFFKSEVKKLVGFFTPPTLLNFFFFYIKCTTIIEKATVECVDTR